MFILTAEAHLLAVVRCAKLSFVCWLTDPSPALPKGKGEPFSGATGPEHRNSFFTEQLLRVEPPFPLGRVGDGSAI